MTISENLIFAQSRKGRYAHAQAPQQVADISDIAECHLRQSPLGLPEVSELQVVRHYTRLSQLNYGIDSHFYPLGSCTMKYNPRAFCYAELDGLANRHPLALVENSQGFLQAMFELQDMLAQITGMAAVSLSPMAGAQGEYAGVAMIRAYHLSRGDHQREEIIVPDAAHGTNPATARMCGFKVYEVPTGPDGDVDIEALKKVVGPKTAGIMLTNPSTLGVFERKITEIADIMHQAGALMYYDGANLNAILGKVRPGDMGFDVIHLNLHKTFATPHGGGGPGAGPVAVSARLKPFLPTPTVIKNEQGYEWLEQDQASNSIGRLSAFMGNAGVLLRAYIYIRMLGRNGLHRIAEFATLNANYLMAKLQQAGFDLAFSNRRASHEFIITLQDLAKNTGVTAKDFAKRLLDYGFYAPTVYFPLLIPECMLIEPTETECKEVLDDFIAAMAAILKEAKESPSLVKNAPHTCPISRLDEVKAARELDLRGK